MKKKFVFIIFVVLAFLSRDAWCQDTAQIIDPMRLPVSIRAVKIVQYEDSPLQINGKTKWSNGIWKWIIENSIFADSTTLKEKRIDGRALIKDICYGDGVVDIVVSIDSVLYEVITINDDEICGLEAIEIGKEYPLSLFPYYNHSYTMAYNRNTPIFLYDFVIWITRRKLDSNIYVTPDLKGAYYCPATDATKSVLKAVRYQPETVRTYMQFK